MSPSAILIMLVSALTHAAWNFLTKSAADSRAFMGCLLLSSLCFLLPVSAW